MHDACRRITEDWRIAYLPPGAVVNWLGIGLRMGGGVAVTQRCAAVCGGVSSGKGCLAPGEGRALHAWAMRILLSPRFVPVVHLVL